MEIILGIGIGALIGLLFGKKKSGVHNKTNAAMTNASATAKTDRHKLQQADEELITVILPTINNDK
jgi:hypothetical protein